MNANKNLGIVTVIYVILSAGFVILPFCTTSLYQLRDLEVLLPIFWGLTLIADIVVVMIDRKSYSKTKDYVVTSAFILGQIALPFIAVGLVILAFFCSF